MRSYSSLVSFGGLVENGVGDSDFADVVKERCNFEIGEARFVHSHFAGHVERPFRQARAVNACVQILQVEQLIQRADQRSAQSGELLLHFFDAQRREIVDQSGRELRVRFCRGRHEDGTQLRCLPGSAHQRIAVCVHGPLRRLFLLFSGTSPALAS